MGTFDLKGRTVLITGASSGIGRAAAFAFAREGANLVIAARRLQQLSQVAKELEALGVKATPARCDVTSDREVAALAARVEEAHGGLDVLVNNAGVGLYGPVDAITEEQLQQAFAVNFFGLWRVTRACLPLLRKRGAGQIVNVSSVLGHRGLPMLGGYCASKAAVNSLTESMRLELREQNIDVLLVSPGLTESEFRDARMHAPGFEQEQVPLKAMSAEDVADALVSASRHRRAQTILTLPGLAMVYGNRLSPTLFDRLAGRLVGPPKATT